MARVHIEDGWIDEAKASLVVDFFIPGVTGRGKKRITNLNGQRVLFVPDDQHRPVSLTELVNSPLNQAIEMGVTSVAMSVPRKGLTRDIYEIEAMEEELLLALMEHPFTGSVALIIEEDHKQTERLRRILLG